MTDRNRELSLVGWKNGWLISMGIGIGLLYGPPFAEIASRPTPVNSIVDNQWVSYLFSICIMCLPPAFGVMYDVWWPKELVAKKRSMRRRY
jgi:hypothetical protein